MRYLSVCSGIEAATVAWHPLGFSPVAFSEIEKFPSAVLAHHYPQVPNLGDMTRFKDWPDADISLLVGGTPCQSFSVAGLRKGLADPRGNLALTYLALVDRYRPEWFIWENVPGVLSSGEGRDFGALLGGMAELGFGYAYRVLDAQYVRVDGFERAVPQRRRRVFVVGNSRSWRRAAAVLFEPESLSGDTPPRRQTGERVAPTISARPTGGGGLGTDFDCDGGLIAFGGNNTSGPVEVSTALQAHAGPAGRMDFASETFVVGAMQGGGTPNGHGTAGINQQWVEAGYVIPVAATLTRGAESSGKGGYAGRRREDDHNLIAFDTTQITRRSQPQPGAPCHPLAAGAHAPAIAFDARQSDVIQYDEMTGPLDTDGHTIAVNQGWAVRRLTPRECERLQGFPDDYTAIPKAADGPRYKALGNSMAVNVMRWLGQRIAMVDQISTQESRHETN